ncbi:putative chromatin remodeler Bromodomain family [Helianthus annuus]|nr:putative chromatin remodeler Bromodomain family [Helianthus annuus]KAJ0718345.1 putative chromatin remodeler Bromodomain family [Helianthus annuus]
MGKAGGATPSPAKKKKGRPSLTDLKKRALEQQQSHRRSTRRNPNSDTADASADEDDYYDDDDDERKQKKVKLVVRLPQLNQQQEPQRRRSARSSSPANSASCGSDSNADVDIRQIESGSGCAGANSQDEKDEKAMESLHGSPLETGPTTPLPDKKLLLFILDRLQKKDTHAVFSEPVDPVELPDYHEIIEHPMDFGTVRSKLDKGLYSNLEELEADVYLICSNAMQYNSSDTVFFRQARSIQELAKRDFENLRQEGDDGELQPKVVRRGRPPSKHLKKPPGRTSLDIVVAPESTSGATTVANTVANTVDNTNDSTPYNLRRGPMIYKNYADGLFPSSRTRNGEHNELLADWNEEFPARIKRADMKYGNKHFVIDESRRDTYKQFHPLNNANTNSLLTNFGGEGKQLLAVGVHAEHGYSRSLARFAANMGPVVWEIASKKIRKALPPGVTFGPGVVGEPEPPAPSISFLPSENYSYTPRLASNDILNKPETPSTSGPKAEDSEVKSNKTVPHSGKNGFNDDPRSHLSKRGTIDDTQGTKGDTSNPENPTWQQVPSMNHRQFTVPVPPDLNVGVQGPSVSPGYVGLKIGSPQQPDLALQL